MFIIYSSFPFATDTNQVNDSDDVNHIPYILIHHIRNEHYQAVLF